ncbi:putative pumilio homolog 8, chloroplastic [Wolffia australiana]
MEMEMPLMEFQRATGFDSANWGFESEEITEFLRSFDDFSYEKVGNRVSQDHTEFGLINRLRSVQLDDDVSVEPYALWGTMGDVATASDLINDSFDEARSALVQPRQLYPRSEFHFSRNSLLGGSCSETVESLCNDFWENPFDSGDPWEMGSAPISPQTVLQPPIGKNSWGLKSPRSHHKLYTASLGNCSSIAAVAKDQQGCRHLQRVLDEGSDEEREMIFNEILYHMPELMVNPFGNYLVQKVLDVCTDQQRLEIVYILTAQPAEIVNIAMNMHGTRALQKLIEIVKNEEEISLVSSVIQANFLNLATDGNANHVVQRCLRHFSYEQSRFIFEAAAKYCIEIATHRHGCCVLQQCIAYSTGQHKENLLTEVSLNALALAQDAYGNYAVQYILDMVNHSAIETIKFRLKGNYGQLSMQKFSSNVVEKCLRVFDETGKKMIISELLSVSCFDLLMQDPYANYVIQSALLVCKGQLRNTLADAIRSRPALRSNPYCRRIFNLVKK